MSAHEGSTNAQFGWSGMYEHIYPPPPNASPMCPLNVDYDTLPNGYPMRTTILGPTSLKHLYRGALYYPPQYMKVPKGTLYDNDFSTFIEGTRRTYQPMLYPFKNRSPRETIGVSEDILPLPAIQNWTEYKVLYDGAFGR